MQKIHHKRGDTFFIANRLTQDNAPIDLTGWTVRSQVRDGDTLVQSLTYAVAVAADGQYTLTAPAASTASWPVKTLLCDIEYTSPGGTVTSTETFQIVVIRDVTV